MNAAESLGDRVRAAVTTHRLFTRRSRIVVAVSGGPDSVALLHLLCSLREAFGLTLHVAHLDHALRPDAAEDAAFVETLARRWSVSATIERRPVGEYCAKAGWSLEDGARRVRYQFLVETARAQAAQAIAVAHTADDQAETVLLRLTRGTGLAGLGAMPMKRPLEDRVWLIRPLLGVWRHEVEAYCAEHRLEARHDPTNGDRERLRNRIRHELLPLLEQRYNPQMKAALVRLAEQSQRDHRYLHDAASRQWKRTARVRQQGATRQVHLTVGRFLRQPVALQSELVRQAVECLQGDTQRFEFRHWQGVLRLFRERPIGTRLDLPGGIQLERRADQVVCRRAATEPDDRI